MRGTMPTQRYKITIAYRGTKYHGWQKQLAVETYKGPPPAEGEGIPTIQETVCKALMMVLRHPITLVGSSRTDSGVHAKGQVGHFDTDQVQIPIDGLRAAVNHALPPDVLLRKIEPVPNDFDAIRWTISKRYQYAIWNTEDRSVFFSDLAWHRWAKLDIEAMKEAAGYFVGEHDFTSFARPGHGREHAIRTIVGCDVSKRGPLMVIGIEGTGFLWNMVRIMVGTLVEVGMGRTAPGEIKEMLEAKNRQNGGPTAPPHGLYLQWIRYGDRDMTGIRQMVARSV